MVIRTQKSAIPTNAGGGIYCQVQSTRSLTYVRDDNSVIPGEADRPTRNPALSAGESLLQEILRFSYVWHSPDNGLRFLTYVRNDIWFEKGVFGVTPSWLFFLWDNLATGILHYAYATFRMTFTLEMGFFGVTPLWMIRKNSPVPAYSRYGASLMKYVNFIRKVRQQSLPTPHLSNPEQWFFLRDRWYTYEEYR